MDPILKVMDATAFLSEMAAGSVDLLVTDPAYESLEKHRNHGTTTRLKKSKGSSNAWFPIFPNSRFPEFLEQVYRVLATNSHFYMICDQETMFVVKPMAEAIGFKFWKFLVWDKIRFGMGYHYRNQHELVLFFEKGKRKLQNLGIGDVLRIQGIRGGYPTEKPIPLAEVLIQQSSSPGELVVDPFMGSGFVAAAATRHGRVFAGSDLNPNSPDLVRKAIANALPLCESSQSMGNDRRVVVVDPHPHPISFWKLE